MLSPQEALVYTMVVAAEADHEIDDAEINLIGDLGNHLPAFREIGREALTEIAVACSEALAQPGGRQEVFGLIREALPRQLRGTAYALACDVVAVDRRLQRSEIHALEWLRRELEVEPALARTIEEVAEVRFKAA
jgi:uncharacterized membrane protein YebE (DUF533 family)